MPSIPALPKGSSPTSDMPIGDLSRRSGVKVPTIRYYETIGLLPEVPRSAGNRRLYDPAMVDRLRFIRHARELGFDIEAIRDLLTLSERPQSSCAAADGIVMRHLATVEHLLRCSGVAVNTGPPFPPPGRREGPV